MDNIKISFTQFIDFTLKQDASRVNYVKKLKYQPEYHPAFDYWKILRDELKVMLERAYPVDYLVDLPVRVEQRKRENYLSLE